MPRTSSSSSSADGSTIVAPATPPGPGLLAVVRLSGPAAVRLAGGRPGAVVRLAPRSYTGEDLVELFLPASPPLVERLVRELVDDGARPARPGEFTLRAFLNGRLDLVRAEAVEQVISAEDDDERRAALAQLEGGLSRVLGDVEGDLLDLCADVEAAIDFVDQDIEILPEAAARVRAAAILDRLRALRAECSSRRVASGLATVVLYGKPNAGKSSLFNALAGTDAIVSPAAGTTRDALSADVDLGAGVRVRLVDTAGAFEGVGLDAAAGARSAAWARSADLVLWVTDAGLPPGDGPEGAPCLRVSSRIDLGGAEARVGDVATSSKTGEGLDALREAIRVRLGGGATAGRFRVNARQSALLADAERALEAAAGLAPSLGMEFVAVDLRGALAALGGITGRAGSEDLLDRVFSRFCLGK